MRIISGKYRGRNINPPNNLPVRPTTDYAKTALFNILNNYYDYEDLDVLDLFSGTGNISFEFASRGVRSLLAVDANYNCVKFIKESFDKMGEKSARVVKYDAFKFIKACSQKFDIIFADPPYDLEEAKELPDLVFSQNILKPGGVFIFEQSDRKDFSSHPNFREKRDYGKTAFFIFELKDQENG